MTTAHELMEQLRSEGAERFAATDLARDHMHVERRVRRDRAVRASLVSAASVVVAGAAVFGISQSRDNTVDPAVSVSSTPQPAPSHSAFSIAVAKQDHIDSVASLLARPFGVSTEVGLQVLTNALPPEANGNPEGWVLAGDHTLSEHSDAVRGLQQGAEELVGLTTQQLESLGVPRDKWAQTVVLASIIQQEAPASTSDQAAVARVLLNRIAQGMPLQVDSVPDSYTTTGLPAAAIGAFTPETLEAAANPAEGDWYFFLRDADGSVRLFSTYSDFATAAQAQNATP